MVQIVQRDGHMKVGDCHSTGEAQGVRMITEYKDVHFRCSELHTRTPS